VNDRPKTSVAAAQPWRLLALPRVWIVAIALALIFAIGWRWTVSRNVNEPSTTTEDSPSADTPTQGDLSLVPRVDVVLPRVGGVVNSTTQPGSVEAYNSANLFAKVSGYLEQQPVDIGDRVKEGQLLAQIDAPELVQAVNQAAAELEQARAQLQLNEAALAASKADVSVAQATVSEKRAQLKRAEAFFEFHKIQYSRMNDLFKLKSIDERAVDENRKERDSAEAARNIARAAIRTAEADLNGKQALEQQAEADVADAHAKVQVGSAVLKKANVYVDYTKLRSPYNGIITQRSYHVGDFVRAAEQGGQTPVLTVAETDLMRVVVKMPEEFVPLTDPGNPAVFRLNFTDHAFEGKIARIANSLDRNDKTMRTEIDLPNPTNELRDGMYGYATIELGKSLKSLSIPSRSLLTKAGSKLPTVFVVRDNRVRQVSVKVATNTGARAEVLSGLRPDDQVVLQPNEDLADGQTVRAVVLPDGKAK
jgi:HlyD family secretion protein